MITTLIAAIQQLYTLSATCDGCGKVSGAYTASKLGELPAGWVSKLHWGTHYLGRREYCSEACAGRDVTKGQ